MEQASQLKSSTKIAALSQEMHSCQSDIDHLYNELEALTTTCENYDKEYTDKLNES